MKPLRILQVFTILNRGGAETNIMNYYRHIDRSKIQFDFLVHREEVGDYEEEIIKLGGTIYRLPAIHPLNLRQYKKEVKRFFDIHADKYKIIHGQLSELGVFIYEEAKKRGVPVIIAHAHTNPTYIDFKTFFRYKWKKEMMQNVTDYFTCSDESSKWLFGVSKIKDCYKMYNAIPTSKFKFQSSRSKQNEKYVKYVHIGTFNKIKNHKFLIKIFSEIYAKNSNSKLFLVGSGELHESIVKLVKKMGLQQAVTFMGSKNDVDVLLQEMDVFVFPSLFEGLGIAFIEAQTAGLPCFISDGIPEEAILIPDNVEVVSLKKSAKEWAEIILRKTENFERKDVSNLIIEAGYDIKENAKKLEQKYIELLAKTS